MCDIAHSHVAVDYVARFIHCLADFDKQTKAFQLNSFHADRLHHFLFGSSALRIQTHRFVCIEFRSRNTEKIAGCLQQRI